MLNDVLYPHERIAYTERLERYYELTIAMFYAALGAELECIQWGDSATYEDRARLEIQLDNLDYYGSYYALYTRGE